jgi:gliding motility-associated protein GldM
MASMRNSNHINTYIEASNKQLLANMEETIKTKVQYEALVHKALEIQSLTTAFHESIYSIKDLVAQESQGVYTEYDEEAQGNAELIGMPKDGSNKKVIEQVFISGKYGGANTQEQQGPALYHKLTQLKENYLDAVASLWDNGGIRGTVFADLSKKASLLAELSSNLSLSDYGTHFNEATWIKENFKGKTIEEAHISLTQCQTQVNLSMAAVLQFLSAQMGKLELTYDKLDVLAQAPKNYVLLGETYEAEIALGAYSTQARFSVSVDGRALSIVDNKAKFSTKASSVGEKTYKAKISVVNPQTDEIETFTKTFKYEVGQPAINVTADKQNILYIGVDNPVTIAAAGIVSSAVKVSATGASLTKTSSSGYIATVNRPGEVLIIVKNVTNGKSYPFKFRAKRIPNPIVKMGGQVDGTLSSSEFKAAVELTAVLENFDYEAKCQVQSYDVTYTRKRQDAVLLKGKGARFSGEVEKVIQQAKPGDQYSFTEVVVRCSGDQSARRVNGLSFRIK